ncbi:MAG: hypothetical protein LBQ05_00065 [Christensenellaceae bacterium]|nr:hypothetical protein [Christensenellaceae bacterium]
MAVNSDSDEPFGVRPWATDEEQAEKLWKLSEKMTGVKFDILRFASH